MKPVKPARRQISAVRPKKRLRGKTGPDRWTVSGFKWLDNVETAYKRRAELVSALNSSKGKYVFRRLLSYYDFTPAEKRSATWEASKNSPAINIFIKLDKNKANAGESSEVEFPRIGDIQVNVIFLGKKSQQNEATKAHEEAHVQTALGREYLPRLRSLHEVRERIYRELISHLSEQAALADVYAKSNAERKVSSSIVSGIFDASEGFFKRLEKSRIIATPAQRLATNNQLQGIVNAINDARKHLGWSEILMVLRQADWKIAPRALRERVSLPRRYLK